MWRIVQYPSEADEDNTDAGGEDSTDDAAADGEPEPQAGDQATDGVPIGKCRESTPPPLGPLWTVPLLGFPIKKKRISRYTVKKPIRNTGLPKSRKMQGLFRDF